MSTQVILLIKANNDDIATYSLSRRRSILRVPHNSLICSNNVLILVIFHLLVSKS